MLIPVKDLATLWNVTPDGVLHVGAHMAEEMSDYIQFSWQGSNKIIWVEAQPALANILKSRLDPQFNEVICATAWDESGVVKHLKVASNSQSSSLLDFNLHSKFYPSIRFVDSIEVTTTRLEQILEPKLFFNFINLDIQGVELQALRGLESRLREVSWIYCEVNKKSLYVNCTRVKELDEYLKSLGFYRLITKWVVGKGWGDALYVRISEVGTILRIRAFLFQLSQLKYGLQILKKAPSVLLRKCLRALSSGKSGD